MAGRTQPAGAEAHMETTYSNARAKLATLMDKASDGREPVIINRQGKKGVQRVALIAADELASLEETAHLFRSPKNAQRLLAAIARALSDKVKPSTVDDLAAGVGLGRR
jgi:antitoxin YefM